MPKFGDAGHYLDYVRTSLRAYGSAEGDTPLLVDDPSYDNLRVSLWYQDRNCYVINTISDGISNSQYGLNTVARGYLYNGTTYDKARSNIEATLLASAARTTDTASPDQTNYNGRGVLVCLAVTDSADTPSIVLHVQGKFGTNYEDLLVADAAVTGAGIHTYVVYPSTLAAGDDIVEVAQLPLPRTWRVNIVHADADSITYAVFASVIL